jgi:hypothetical protein
VEHFVFCHPDSSLLNTAVFCISYDIFEYSGKHLATTAHAQVAVCYSTCHAMLSGVRAR